MFFTITSISSILCFSFHLHKLSLKKQIFLDCILLLSLFVFIISITQNRIIPPRIYFFSTISFDDHWQFSFDQKNWINVTLPHTPRIEPIEKIEQQWQGICFYRKRLIIDDISSHMTLRFDAAMHETDVWINDQHIARHLGGYLPFHIDLPINRSRILNIFIKLRNTDNPIIPPGKNLSSLDFNYYGGLYRHVWLIKQSNQYRLNHSIRINYENVTKTQAIIIAQFQIISNSNDLKNCHIRFLLNAYELYPFNISNSNQVKFLIYNPNLWSPVQPNLYRFTIELVDIDTKNIIYDQKIITIGIRSFEFHPDSQYLFLNGEKFDYIVGTNRHQEYPYIGYALSDSAQYRDAYKIKQAGFNLVRCSHYPPSTAFLDACDSLGILVINSIPGWQYFGNQTFQKHCFDDIEQMIERDYNHPSILLWEVSLNESPMDKQFMIEAHNIAKRNKPDGLTGGWIDDEQAYDVFMPARQHAQWPDFYKNYRAKNNKILFICEYGDWEYYGTLEANFNQTNINVSAFKHFEQTSRQRRKYGQKRLLTQAKNFQQAHNDNRRSSQTTRIMGDANWLMFDYKRGYAPDIEASGIMEITRLPKFAFYFYQ
jgi:beta-galactosidase